jgi:hypothetical protein
MPTTETRTESIDAKTVQDARRAFTHKHQGHDYKVVAARRAVPGDRTSPVVIHYRRA